MPEAAINITDTDLLTQLKDSYIADEQKEELETLIPEMKDEEKTKLLNLIEQSKVTHEKAQKEHQIKFETLNPKQIQMTKGQKGFATN